ncbi:MAG: plasmid pRiA4b ORF-3 family protein [Burkholderiaceae bacterium]|nr:plasmid pRiA4b ORF-3 family protein [Sulfuritalea sp.]MCF8174590.1 plasmid pRiA4b ORF-3 family protein [Burkholderiaceae bacterium]MCF8184630.1 plasmid pRiA4b ORF-3 family protein [Polynucleobacter sp.]
MATRKPATAKAPESICILRIDLAHLKPPVWRRLEVPANITLTQLHRVIQMAFDWDDSHMHSFEIAGRRYGQAMPDPFGVDLDELDERKFLLRDVAGVGNRFTYTYDFGDDWHHLVKVEKILAPTPGTRYPRCTAGKNAAPPEDCGGPWGYAEMVQALADPDYPGRDELLEWLDENFDPTEFDRDKLNIELGMLKV